MLRVTKKLTFLSWTKEVSSKVVTLAWQFVWPSLWAGELPDARDQGPGPGHRAAASDK